MTAVIRSSANPRIKDFRRLIHRGETDSQNRLPVEGIRLIQEAIESAVAVDVLYVAEGRVEEGTIRLLIDSLKGAEVVQVSDPVFAGMVGTESPQGIAALVKLPQFHWAAIAAIAPLVVVAWQLQDPGNLGTLFRSADAFGVTAILLAKNTVSPYNQKVVRSSAGSIFRLPCFHWDDTERLLQDLQRRKFRLITTSSHSGSDFREVDYKGATALFIGNEGRGLPHHLVKRADVKVRIPQARIESLNAAVAASIILAESWSQRSQ